MSDKVVPNAVIGFDGIAEPGACHHFRSTNLENVRLRHSVVRASGLTDAQKISILKCLLVAPHCTDPIKVRHKSPSNHRHTSSYGLFVPTRMWLRPTLRTTMLEMG
jgi:hypothetical protein